MGEFVVLARWRIQAGQRGAVHAALAPLVAGSRSEPGNLEYQPLTNPDDGDLLLIYERYRDRAAFEVHLTSEHFRTYCVQQIVPLLQSRDRDYLEPWHSE